MQSLLTFVFENLHQATPSQTSQLLYSIVKLRFPEDALISALTEQAETQLFEMNPKDVALICWALARTDYPSNGPIAKKLASYIYHLVRKI
jgi:hypothetical protein